MAKPKGLGRGLDALLSNTDEDTPKNEGSLQTLSISDLKPGKYQPRSIMQEEALHALSQSILKQGVMQPIIVRPIGNNQYEIIAGERRWRAAKLANLNEVPVIIKNIPDESALAMALIENIQREDLNPLEEAIGIKRLIDEFNMTHEEAADAVGKSRVTVSNLLRLLTLTKPVQDRLLTGKIDMGHARALIGLEGSQQIMLCEEAIQKNLSVREVEALVKNLQNGYKKDTPKSSSKKMNADVRQLEESLAETLGASVTIDAKKNGSGTLKVHYRNLEQLDEILHKIKR
ncbi:MAG TPA: chromosome partitioning protein ParB [Methylophilaceae bacterium]|jgi:ParB family chromosome partitioning protein|nr:chromosome partitioning protein ParB [Methylophilaceae bacterium]HBO18146.1 chromosome partitioning protein ParB [Methylophilaceae bacterium]HCC72658.1 chromosome partitioning protein ParB [Methylophilaceae bacterium]